MLFSVDFAPTLQDDTDYHEEHCNDKMDYDNLHNDRLALPDRSTAAGVVSRGEGYVTCERNPARGMSAGSPKVPLILLVPLIKNIFYFNGPALTDYSPSFVRYVLVCELTVLR